SEAMVIDMLDTYGSFQNEVAAPPGAPRVRVDVTGLSLDRLSAANEIVKSGNAAVGAQRGPAVEVTPVTERGLDFQAHGAPGMG
ncbi:MAG TPA: hypothetical protein VE462_09985, partial [Propionibacteriaceae bacterium]|nr:hypothetical protein [Propionibacteriaceae bacterium]